MDAALVGVLGILLGVIATAIITRVIEVRRRFDREIELIIALHAEMVAGLRRANKQTTREEIDYVEHDDDPFGVADETDFVFESIKADPSTLPKEIIHSVVRYYKLAAQTNALTKGYTDPRFPSQSPKSKQKYARQLIDLLKEQQDAGVAALGALEHAAESRNERGLAIFKRQANIPDVKSVA